MAKGKNLSYDQTRGGKYTVGLVTEVDKQNTTASTTLHGGDEDHIILNIKDWQFNCAPDGNLYINHIETEKTVLVIDTRGNIKPQLTSFKSKKEALEENDLPKGALYTVNGSVYQK